MTEIGPLGIECPEQPGGLHLLETDYVAEVIDPADRNAGAGRNAGRVGADHLGRPGSPLLRYRTGDLVRRRSATVSLWSGPGALDGGIRGRVDDMIVLRGNNVHPSALQTILHRFPEVAEYRIEVDRSRLLPVLRIEVEPLPGVAGDALAERVDQAIRDGTAVPGRGSGRAAGQSAPLRDESPADWYEKPPTGLQAIAGTAKTATSVTRCSPPAAGPDSNEAHHDRTPCVRPRSSAASPTATD